MQQTLKPYGSLPVCLGSEVGESSVKEFYETSTGDHGRRAQKLRSLGYRVLVASIGRQTTPLGDVKVTMVHISRGYNLDLRALPKVEVQA